MTTTSARAHGPSALGGGARRFVELTITLARTDFKLRYFGSVLGYFWQLARPLLFFGVIYVFFTQIIGVDKGVPHYGVYLLTGIVLWTFFGEATGNAVQSLVAREAMLRKVRFPRLAVPLSVTLTSVFNLAMNSIAVIVFALINGVTPTWTWLWMLPIMLGFVMLALGIGMTLSALFVRFRDVQPIWEVLVQVLFYATPIMYPTYKYAQFEHVAMASPFATLITQMGYAFIHPGAVATTTPGIYEVGRNHLGKLVVVHTHTMVTYSEPMRSAVASAGGWGPVLVAIALIPITFGIGLALFIREAPRVAENL